MLTVKNSNIKSIKVEIKVYLFLRKSTYSLYPSSFSFMYRDDDMIDKLGSYYTHSSKLNSF